MHVMPPRGLAAEKLESFSEPGPFFIYGKSTAKPAFPVVTSTGSCRTNSGVFKNPKIEKKTTDPGNDFYRFWRVYHGIQRTLG